MLFSLSIYYLLYPFPETRICNVSSPITVSSPVQFKKSFLSFTFTFLTTKPQTCVNLW